MKGKVIRLLVLALLCESAQFRLSAQAITFTPIYDFSSPYSNDDGINPIGPLNLLSNMLYGAAYMGGSTGRGTLFSVNTDGSEFTNLHTFTVNSGPDFTNGDGASPVGIIVSGDTVYGTAVAGGTDDQGTVFRINTDGSGFTNLHSFGAAQGLTSVSNADGIQPFAGVIMSNNRLYGTTRYGGTWGGGTVFRVDTDGSEFTNLYSFSPFTNHNALGISTNGDGASPHTGVILSGNTLYGTTFNAGTGGHGTVFSLNTDGSGFTNLHNFTNDSEYQGGGPSSALVISGNMLFGTAESPSGNLAAVFRMNTDGSGFTNLYIFSGGSDGGSPTQLTLVGNAIYGVAEGGGSGDTGTLFRMKVDGSEFTNFYNFPPDRFNYEGAGPDVIVLSGNIIYGTTQGGGTGGTGAVYALTLLPPLEIASVGNQTIISWPFMGSSFMLQTTASLSSGIWSNITDGVSTDGTNYFLTTATTNQTAFFRLVQQ